MKIGIFLSSLGLTRGGLETIAARFAEGLARRGHAVTCVAGGWPGRSLPSDLADLPVAWLRVPCIPPTLPLGPFATSRRGRAWRLKMQSLSFMAACRLRRPVRRLWNTAEVTLSLLEIETVYLSAWRARQRLPHLSYFSGAIDWRWLRRDRSTLRLHLLGDGPLRPILEARVREAGLTQRVTFFGVLSPARVRAELSRADLFLFPSHYESFGIAVVEAQAAGVPVLCSDLPVLQEASGGAAYLAPPRTVAPWVQAAERLLADEAARRRLSEAGRRNAQRYTWARKVEDLEHFLWQAQKARP